MYWHNDSRALSEHIFALISIAKTECFQPKYFFAKAASMSLRCANDITTKIYHGSVSFLLDSIGITKTTPLQLALVCILKYYTTP